MSIKTITAVAAILILLGSGYAVARPENGGSWSGKMGSYGNGSRITGGYGSMMKYFGTGLWNGMMGFYRDMMGIYRSMMGYGRGMMGNYGNNRR